MADTAHDREEVKLSQAASYLLDESRMVLPGIQAIFGFQLIAVFSDRFTDLPEFEQHLHFASLSLIALAAALVMTPAAWHRISGLTHVSRHFLDLGSRFLLASMLALAVGLTLDYYVVGFLVFASGQVAWLAALLLGACTALWFVLPARHKRQVRGTAP
jgi:hypothetical protein